MNPDGTKHGYMKDPKEPRKKKMFDDDDSGKEDKEKRLMPRKSDFRMRAHINPLNDTPFPYPLNPDYVNWQLHYPSFYGGTTEQSKDLFLNTPDYPNDYPEIVDDKLNGKIGSQVEILDIGCGFGGLSVALSPVFPEKLILGMEIRDKLVNYVGERIRALRMEHPGKYGNVSVLRTNAMRHITNYFRKGQLSTLFFCFPDPHFKTSTHRRRIVNVGLLSEYAYLLKPKGRIYCITDVEPLHEWHVEKLSANKQFRRVTEDELQNDVLLNLIANETEEAKKVSRNGGKKFHCVYERL